MNENTKKKRQKLLKQIINGRQVGDQNQLLLELEKAKIEATQATVSRDLAEMGVVKVRVDSGKYVYQLFEKLGSDVIYKKLKVLFHNFVHGVRGTNNQLLVFTSPGNANGVANFIDRLEWDEILGTVAGDDTILVIITDQPQREKIQQRFQDILNNQSE